MYTNPNVGPRASAERLPMKRTLWILMLLLAVSANATVFKNGPVTDFVQSGQPVSRVIPPDGAYGLSADHRFLDSVAEDFTVTHGGWTVQRISLYVYVPNQPNLPVSQLQLWIRAGLDPNAGATVYVTDRNVTSGAFVGYRVHAGNLSDTTRAMYRIDVDMHNQYLAPGGYTLHWSFTPTINAPPSIPSTAPFIPGNASRSTSGGLYFPAADGSSGRFLTFPFEIQYRGHVDRGHLYATDGTTRSVNEIDMNTGAYGAISTVSAGVTPASLTQNPASGTIYLGSTSNASLYSLNVSSGLATLIGGFGDASILMHGLEYVETSNALYGVSSHNGGLYTMNPATGAATLRGLTGVPGFLSLGYDNRRGIMYGTSSSTDSLYTVNGTTGAFTLVGPLNNPINPAGMAYNWQTDTMYVIDNIADTLYTVNLATGQATEFASLSGTNMIGLVYAGPPTKLQGQVTLEGWTGPVAGRQVTVTVMTAGTDDVCSIESGPLDANGRFCIGTTVTGTYDVYIKASHWLQKMRASVNINTLGANNVNVTLLNGDADHDNEVGIGDYSLLSASYNKNLGDVGYNAEADLNGDDTVDIGDYALLSANYGLAGD